MKKKILVLLSIVSLLSPTTALAKDICIITAPIPSVASDKNTDSIMPMSDVIIWRYKAIGDKMYRRKYNTTKKQWIGEWELIP